MNLAIILKAFDYKLNSGSEFQCKCYPNSYSISLSSDYAEISVVFSTLDQTVYEVVVDASADYADSSIPVYRWMNPDWKSAYETEAGARNINPKIAFDDIEYVDLEISEDFLVKARNMFDGKFDFDKRIRIDIELAKDDILLFAMQAHKNDITLNEYINQLLTFGLKHDFL